MRFKAKGHSGQTKAQCTVQQNQTKSCDFFFVLFLSFSKNNNFNYFHIHDRPHLTDSDWVKIKNYNIFTIISLFMKSEANLPISKSNCSHAERLTDPISTVTRVCVLSQRSVCVFVCVWVRSVSLPCHF